MNNIFSKTITVIFIILVSTLTFSSSAEAKKKVFLNGMDLSKYLIVDTVLKGVTVKFDKKGNIYLIAKGYNFNPEKSDENKEDSKDSKVDPKATEFYLVSFPKPAKANIGYDIDLMINGKFVKRIYSNDGQVVYPITKSLKKGKNKINLISKKKKLKGDKKPSGSMKIAIARGYESKGNYLIKKLIWSVSRSSSDKKKTYYQKKIIKK
ncbi:MAG: hypothetical protein ACQES9_02745 [Myxococcota bacterium]